MLYAPENQLSLLCSAEFIFRLSIKLSIWGGASVMYAVSQQLIHVQMLMHQTFYSYSPPQLFPGELKSPGKNSSPLILTL